MLTHTVWEERQVLSTGHLRWSITSGAETVTSSAIIHRFSRNRIRLRLCKYHHVSVTAALSEKVFELLVCQAGIFYNRLQGIWIKPLMTGDDYMTKAVGHAYVFPLFLYRKPRLFQRLDRPV